jgi:hypothetical protein
MRLMAIGNAFIYHELPPLTDNFYVTRDALFEFLTRQLNPEAQDLGDRAHKKLMGPKTVQELYNLSKTVSPEEKYYSAIRLLDQWNDKYIEQKDKKHDATDYDKWKQARVNAAKIQSDLVKQEACFKKLDEIMEKFYANIKSTPLYRRILENLKKAAKKYLYVEKSSNSEENIREFNIQIEKLYRDSSFFSCLHPKNEPLVLSLLKLSLWLGGGLLVSGFSSAFLLLV